MENVHLGEFEELVLLAVCGLPNEAYTLTIRQRLLEKTGRRSTLGSLYRTLSRLEKKGYVRSHMGSVTHEPGGKRKRYYEVTGTGKEAVVAVREARERLWEGFGLTPSSLSDDA